MTMHQHTSHLLLSKLSAIVNLCAPEPSRLPSTLGFHWLFPDEISEVPSLWNSVYRWWIAADRRRGIVWDSKQKILFQGINSWEQKLKICLDVAWEYVNKKHSYRRVSARCVLSLVILPITAQQCRNYLYDKSWPNRWYEVGSLVGGNVSLTNWLSPVYRRLAVAKFSKSTMQKLLSAHVTLTTPT